MIAFLPRWVRLAILLVVLVAACLPAAEAQEPTRIPVPTGVYTVLKFGQPVAKAVMPPTAPLNGKPYFLSHNHVLLLMLQKIKARTPVQAIVQLNDGTTRVLDLVPTPGADATIDVPDTDALAPAPPPVSLAPVPQSRNPAAGVVPVLSALLQGETPSGWTVARVSVEQADAHTLRYNRLTARPIGLWMSGNGRVVEYRLDAIGQAVSTLDPSQFYQPGVKAALLDGSKVGPDHSTTLWLLWELPNGR
ncbi:MAG TPA: type-F conjugative transfer system secretin TraK [Nevskiaceae bacterium]